MFRSIALLGILIAYREADSICQGRFSGEHLWVRAWLPPILLLGGCGAWLKCWPIASRAVPGIPAWAAGVALGVKVCAAVVLAVAAPSPSGGSAHPWFESLALITVVPLAEELLFRGAVLHHLRWRIGTPAGVLVTSALFGCLHGCGTVGWVMCACSLCWCGAVLATGSLLWSVALHAIWNGWVVIHRSSSLEARLGWAFVLGVLALVTAASASALQAGKS